MGGLYDSVRGGESLAVLQDGRERLEEPCLAAWGVGVTRHLSCVTATRATFSSAFPLLH